MARYRAAVADAAWRRMTGIVAAMQETRSGSQQHRQSLASPRERYGGLHTGEEDQLPGQAVIAIIALPSSITQFQEVHAQGHGVRMSEKQPESGDLRFEVDAGLLFQLGEQLVARRSIALAELVKNAYDADATQVEVRLERVTLPGGTIVVQDNGTGMTFEHIRNHWMRIATDDKVRNPVSPVFCRLRTGAKGIGRFAARRLANRLMLHSVARAEHGDKERIVVDFDWTKKFRAGQALTSIPVTYERMIVAESTPTGVRLELQGARDTWGEEDVIDLQRDTLSLVSPFPEDTLHPPAERRCKPDPGFSIGLDVAEFPRYSGELGDQFLAAAWGTLTGYVDDQGTPHYHLDVRETHEGVGFVASQEVYASLADARLTIGFFVYKSDYFDDVDFTVRDAQRMGRQHGGVRIYLDGFRVFPYGEPAEDWLKLNEVRAGRTRRLVIPRDELLRMEGLIPGRPYLLTPGNNQVFGAVAISRLKHRGIEINVSRERLVENEAFEQLRRFVQLGIYWMTLEYARRKAQQDAKEKAVARPGVPEIIEEARGFIADSADLPAESQREILHILDYAKERAQEQQEEHISELSMLRVLSSTGTTIAVINHQFRAVVDGIRAVHTDLCELRAHVSPKVRHDFDKTLSRINDWHEMMKHQVYPLGLLLGTDDRVRRRRLVLRGVVDKVTSPLSLYMRDFGIEFDNKVPRNLRTPPIYEAELYAVLLHLFTNALKAVREEKGREIAVKANRQEDGVHVFVLDTGVGVEMQDREQVFDAFFTTSPPDPILGVGTGLGLKVVSDILETYGGTARFIDAERPWHTCIEIVLPERR